MTEAITKECGLMNEGIKNECDLFRVTTLMESANQLAKLQRLFVP